MEWAYSYLPKSTESGLKIAKIKQCSKNVNIRISRSKGLLIVVPSSSVNMQRLKDGDVELDTRVNIYVRKWNLLLVLNVTK